MSANRVTHVSGVNDTGLPAPRRTLAIACVLGAMVLVVLDAAIANVALPTMARSLEVTPAMSLRVVTAYQLALVIALLPCAALGDALGHRRVFVTGIGLFVAASALCAFAPSLDWLVAARFVQGLGGACVMSLGVALLRFTVSPARLGVAIGWNALTVAITSAAGPTLGALVLSIASWRWLFALNLPIGLGLLLIWKALPHSQGSGRATPLVPVDLLLSRPFRLSIMASICCFIGQTVAMAALPFYLQDSLKLSAMATGLLITPWPIAVAITAPIAGRLSERFPTGLLCAVGGTCLALGLAGAALVPLHERAWPLVPFMLLCGVGFGLFQTPNNRNMFLAVPRERSGAAGGMQGTARLLGQTTGTMVLAMLLTHLPADIAPRFGFALAAFMTLGAAVLSIQRAAPSAAMTRELLQTQQRAY